jgi:hypothetical protein
MRGRSLIPHPDSQLAPDTPTLPDPSPSASSPSEPTLSPTSSAFLSKRLQADIARLDELEQAWFPLACRGDRDAAERVLTIHRQRTTSLHLALAAATASEKAANDAAAANGEREVRVVVEYVDDWRQAGRRSQP